MPHREVRSAATCDQRLGRAPHASWIVTLVLGMATPSLLWADESLRIALSACGITEAAMAAACVDVAGLHVAFEGVRRSPELSGLLDARAAVRIAEQALLDAKATHDTFDPEAETALAAAESAATARSISTTGPSSTRSSTTRTSRRGPAKSTPTAA